MSRIKLVFFKTCPNHQPLKDILDELLLSYEEIDQEQQDENSHYKKFCSPTLLINEKVVLGAESESPGCSLLNLQKESIIKKIKEELNGEERKNSKRVENDLFRSKLSRGRFIFSWLPVLSIVTGLWFSGVSKFTFPMGLLLMSYGCFVNSKKCARRHCFYTAPYFLILAMVSILQGWTSLNFGENGWFLILGLLAFGGIVLAKVIDKTWGNYAETSTVKMTEA